MINKIPLLLFSFLLLFSCENDDDNDDLNETCVIEKIKISKITCLDYETFQFDLNLNKTDNVDPSSQFEVYRENNQKIGTYSYKELPITLEKLSKGAKDIETIEVIDLTSKCTTSINLDIPTCEVLECFITGISTKVKDCIDKNKYQVEVDIEHTYKAFTHKVNVYHNITNKYISTYSLTEFPQIIDIERSGEIKDGIRVDFVGQEDTCTFYENFNASTCEGQTCSIEAFQAKILGCEDNNMLSVEIDFIYIKNKSSKFKVTDAKDQVIGEYLYKDLPLPILIPKLSTNTYNLKVSDVGDSSCSDEFTLEFNGACL